MNILYLGSGKSGETGRTFRTTEPWQALIARSASTSVNSLNARLAFNTGQARNTRRSIVNVQSRITAITFATRNALAQLRYLRNNLLWFHTTYLCSIDTRWSSVTGFAAWTLITDHARVALQAGLSCSRDARRAVLSLSAWGAHQTREAVVAMFTFRTCNHEYDNRWQCKETHEKLKPFSPSSPRSPDGGNSSLSKPVPGSPFKPGSPFSPRSPLIETSVPIFGIEISFFLG